MSNKENEKFHEEPGSTERPRELVREDPLADTSELIPQAIPSGVDRRTFVMRSAVIGAAAAMTGRLISAQGRTLKAFSESFEQQAPSHWGADAG
jgi:hypothetical protein